MSKQYNFNLDEALYVRANEILEDLALDINLVLPILLRKIVKEGNANFLFQTSEIQTSKQQTFKTEINNSTYESKMTKTRAIALLRKHGYKVLGDVSFSSKNKSVDKYWSNPVIDVLEVDWNLILHDSFRKRLYLFLIPSNAIKLDELVVRNDNKSLIDLQILYDDETFTDTRSGFTFCPFLTGFVNYSIR